MSGGKKPWVIRNFEDVEPTACPCGQARRAITGADGAPVSVHRVTIDREAKPHHHERLTEVYIVLRGEGEIVLDGEARAVRPGDVILILPGVVHAARGDLEILNVVSPPFDPADEFLEE